MMIIQDLQYKDSIQTPKVEKFYNRNSNNLKLEGE